MPQKPPRKVMSANHQNGGVEQNTPNHLPPNSHLMNIPLNKIHPPQQQMRQHHLHLIERQKHENQKNHQRDRNGDHFFHSTRSHLLSYTIAFPPAASICANNFRIFARPNHSSCPSANSTFIPSSS